MNIKIMIFGATGFLGIELVNRLIELKYEVLIPNRQFINSKTEYGALVEYFQSERPTCVINCAAITGLDNCFLNQGVALEVNSFFNIKLAAICFEKKIRFLGISTDNVFACAAPDESHTEIDECEPLTWYGKTKFYGEVKQNSNSDLLHTLRLPMLFSPNNKSHILCKLVKKALIGENIKVSTDVMNTPILTKDAVSWIVEWLQEKFASSAFNITHLYSDQCISFYNLISNITAALGSVNTIQTAVASDFSSHEIKPLFGGLQSRYNRPFSLSDSIEYFVSKY